MNSNNLVLALFGIFALGLPIWGMQTNAFSGDRMHVCIDDCYAEWIADTGGVVQIAAAAAQARAEASPAQLGEALYVGCIACHGANGGGGIGPQLAGSEADMIAGSLKQYRAGETRGAQSALMWSQAAELSDADIDNLTAYITTF